MISENGAEKLFTTRFEILGLDTLILVAIDNKYDNNNYTSV